MRQRSFLTFDQIGHWVDSIGSDLRGENYVAIVGVLRGGLFPAQCAAFATGASLHFIRYSRTSQKASWVGDPPPAGKVLLCEDVAGMGQTLATCLELVRQTNPDTDVLAVVSDELSRIQPKWSMFVPGVQTVFPWERHDQAPQHLKDWREGGATGSISMKADHSYRFFGVDMDGVLLDDLHPSEYEDDLSACLARRDLLPMTSHAPRMSLGSHVVITGRPAQDLERTRIWLERHGYGDIPVHHRDPKAHSSSTEAVATHKASTADRIGCSDFIESDPHQAALIAVFVPHIRVYWWNLGQPVLLSARFGRP